VPSVVKNYHEIDFNSADGFAAELAKTCREE